MKLKPTHIRSQHISCFLFFLHQSLWLSNPISFKMILAIVWQVEQCKQYKDQQLSVPLFWFMASHNGDATPWSTALRHRLMSCITAELNITQTDTHTQKSCFGLFFSLQLSNILFILFYFFNLSCWMGMVFLQFWLKERKTAQAKSNPHTSGRPHGGYRFLLISSKV